jgi:hypothetical protein
MSLSVHGAPTAASCLVSAVLGSVVVAAQSTKSIVRHDRFVSKPWELDTVSSDINCQCHQFPSSIGASIEVDCQNFGEERGLIRSNEELSGPRRLQLKVGRK